ncbi:TPA: hypothetical protein ACH3X2_010916 [Trebouxia sp. C0005]
MAPKYLASASAAVQRILDTRLHAAAVGVPLIMIFCIITARSWLRPAGRQELMPSMQKIAGEVVAFGKTATLT